MKVTALHYIQNIQDLNLTSYEWWQVNPTERCEEKECNPLHKGILHNTKYAALNDNKNRILYVRNENWY